jgi:hypothetical protein
MTMERVPDELVDAVDVVARPDGGFAGRSTAAAEHARRVLEAFVTVDREDAEFLLEGARRRQSRGTDGGAFALPDISGEDGVVIEVGAGRTVLVSEKAFGRLIDRLARAVGEDQALS